MRVSNNLLIQRSYWKGWRVFFNQLDCKDNFSNDKKYQIFFFFKYHFCEFGASVWPTLIVSIANNSWKDVASGNVAKSHNISRNCKGVVSSHCIFCLWWITETCTDQSLYTGVNYHSGFYRCDLAVGHFDQMFIRSYGYLLKHVHLRCFFFFFRFVLFFKNVTFVMFVSFS